MTLKSISKFALWRPAWGQNRCLSLFGNTNTIIFGLVFALSMPFSLVAFAANVSIFGNATPDGLLDADTGSVELGVKFQSSVDGQIKGIRFYREVENPDGYVVHLWSETGVSLRKKVRRASMVLSAGWREVTFKTPYNIKAGVTYVASYYTSAGRYTAKNNGLNNAISTGVLTALGGNNGVYKYGSVSSFPNQSYLDSNYFVDVIFEGSGTQPLPAPTVNLTATPSSINVGQSSTLAWSSSNATSCTATGFTTGGAVSGSNSVSPTSSSDYSVICSGAGGSANASVRVSVSTSPPIPNPTPVSFDGPGPSAKLFATNPYYQCVNNRYVATATNGGKDSNNGTSVLDQGNGNGPFLTIQRAIDSLPSDASGYCINIADGNYDVPDININKGGKLASETGFLVIRSMNLLGAKLSSKGFDIFRVVAPYVIIDGLELIGQRTGSGISSCFNGFSFNGVHHIIAMNNYAHGMGESGIKTCWAEYFWIIHNRLDSNAYNTWESGHSTYEPWEIPNYTETAYDRKWTPYHNVYAFNRCSGNFTSPAGGPHTDGNGIIYDDTQHSQNKPNTPYKPMAIIIGNLTWNNGGAGVQVGPGSSNADVFNNTAYNNYLDTYNTGTWRGELSASYASGITYKNNIAYAIVGNGILSNNSSFISGNPVGANSWINNIAFGALPVMYSPNTFSTTANKVNTNPRFVNPAGGNFALCTGVGVPSSSCPGASPAVGTGVVVPYWPQQTPGSIDVGACANGLMACP